jgi:hypothetical protein
MVSNISPPPPPLPNTGIIIYGASDGSGGCLAPKNAVLIWSEKSTTKRTQDWG